ncbi:tRNA pseudouridine(55) synthase TruB [Gilvimarinus sp. F26214L]|uniref:tRNA pseudouridine(55) synthase TruB n=1 Tax=Gilvimarinus sp. DZF01 TaxID=3461371 RepID=UPI0040455E04
MSRRRPKGRPVNGVLLLNKASGITSNAALQQAKRLFFAAKAGHTGSLDPLATGILPICFGEATKFSQYLLDADKRYQSTFCLGIATETGDADGEVIAEADASRVDRSMVDAALKSFVGAIEQVPSMYSAIKYKGQPLYKLAREGKTVEREPRRVQVYSIDVLSFEPGNPAAVTLDIHCSKGTYIRTIAEDLGKALGCGAHVASLHRTQAGPFHIENAFLLDELDAERGDQRAETLDHHLLPSDAPVRQMPPLNLPEQSAFYFRQGQPVMDPQVYQIGSEGDMVRVFSATDDFLGVGEITDDGRVAPKRLLV